ncbi:MAG: M24 family metallopeptidase [Dehalococcoidales bacterium]|nr:M24 family metallopeptidase [Dehalococcoidales bacterium]
MADVLKPGVAMAKVYDEFERMAREAEKLGFNNYRYHMVQTHGIGIMMNEPPAWSQLDVVLRENMIINLEPSVYIPFKHLGRVEDTYLITKEGHERLTRLDQDLYIR